MLHKHTHTEALCNLLKGDYNIIKMPAVAAHTQNCCVHSKEGHESPVQRETPYPKGHLDVLAAPYFHVLVIAANLVEIIF